MACLATPVEARRRGKVKASSCLMASSSSCFTSGAGHKKYCRQSLQSIRKDRFMDPKPPFLAGIRAVCKPLFFFLANPPLSNSIKASHKKPKVSLKASFDTSSSSSSTYSKSSSTCCASWTLEGAINLGRQQTPKKSRLKCKFPKT